MDHTTGHLLRQIIRADFSATAHKLATVILDGIAWKQGFNGLQRGTAAFTLLELAARTRVTRQHLYILLAELEASDLRLERWRMGGPTPAWVFRFAGAETSGSDDGMSGPGDSSLYKENINKNVFTGTILMDCEKSATRSKWLETIRAVKAALPCADVDSRHIWERFRSFNLRRGQTKVPAGFLLGFMRKWRGGKPVAAPAEQVAEAFPQLSDKELELQKLIARVPVANRAFHERDLKRAIGVEEYERRLRELCLKFGCGVFRGKLALHGMAAADERAWIQIVWPTSSI